MSDELKSMSDELNSMSDELKRACRRGQIDVVMRLIEMGVPVKWSNKYPPHIKNYILPYVDYKYAENDPYFNRYVDKYYGGQVN